MESGVGVARPHGGKLVNRSIKKDTNQLLSVSVNADLANDIENIADGIFSPLEGFLLREDFEKVVTRGRLSNELPWTIPIVLDVDKETSTKIKDAKDVALNLNGINFAVLHVEDVFSFDKDATAKGVYGTTDLKHPGVAKTMSMKEFLVGGKIDYIKRP
ncbi:MAG: sulfate adenylyltransferase, partial [Nitrosotalea sp.]